MPSTNNINNAATTVVDAGGRYGMHPTWSNFQGELCYYSFEPDGEEAERLRQAKPSSNYHVIETALSNVPGQRRLNITRHRGYCSFLEPDLESDWFKYYRPGEGEIESTCAVNTTTIDDFSRSRNINIDFLKLDTEGSEYDILLGAEQQISHSILGIRAEVSFQRMYKDQPVFPEMQNYLVKQGFFLVNLAYVGRGVPRSQLVGNPDVLSIDCDKYGILVSSDAVWLLRYDQVVERCKSSEDLAVSILKYAYFCMLNSAPDVAIDALMRFAGEGECEFTSSVRDTTLYRALRVVCIRYLGQWRMNPTDQRWGLARTVSKQVFGLDLEPGHKYWELLQRL